MVTVHMVDADGNLQTLKVEAGFSLMEAARQNGVEGIVAECGGACSCATCHVYVDEGWQPKIAAPDSTEAAMLEFAEGRQANSRLSCQIRLTEALDGLKVTVAEEQ